MGNTRRIVARRDIPRQAIVRSSALTLALRIVTTLALLAGVLWWSLVFQEIGGTTVSDGEARASMALMFQSEAVTTVTQIYGQVLSHQDLSQIEQTLDYEGKTALDDLVARRDSGALDRYVVSFAYLATDTGSIALSPADLDGDIEMIVIVEEYAGSSLEPKLFELRLVETWHKTVEGSSSEGFALDSARPIN